MSNVVAAAFAKLQTGAMTVQPDAATHYNMIAPSTLNFHKEIAITIMATEEQPS